MKRQKWIYNLAFLLAAPLLLSSCGSTQHASGEASSAAVSSAAAATSEASTLHSTESSAEEDTEASSAQTTKAPSADSTETSSGETTQAPSEESTEASSEKDEDSAQLTAYLQYIEDNFCSDSYAGISIRAAGCAAEMMAWYTDAEPTDDEVADTVKAYVDALPRSDRSAFSQGVTMVYESAQDISGENGKELLEDAGYTGDITWTSQDTDAFFHAIFAGLDAS